MTIEKHEDIFYFSFARQHFLKMPIRLLTKESRFAALLKISIQMSSAKNDERSHQQRIPNQSVNYFI